MKWKQFLDVASDDPPDEAHLDTISNFPENGNPRFGKPLG